MVQERGRSRAGGQQDLVYYCYNYLVVVEEVMVVECSRKVVEVTRTALTVERVQPGSVSAIFRSVLVKYVKENGLVKHITTDIS